MSIWYYQGLDRPIACPFPLPELAPDAGGAGKAAIRITLAGAADPDRPGGPVFSDGEIALHPPPCSLVIRGGETLEIRPTAPDDPAGIRTFLLGSGLGALAHQRGLLPLHASAVALGPDAGVVAFSGPSGHGKSTLAAHLAAQGHGLMTDDLCILRLDADRALAFPGVRRLKLWRDALTALGHDADRLPPVQHQLDKRALPPPPQAAARPAPLRALYILDRGEVPGIAPISGLSALEAVWANIFRRHYALRSGQGAALRLACARLAAQVPVFRLTRPWDLGRMQDSVDLLLAHHRTLAAARPDAPGISTVSHGDEHAQN
ncbi:hypothetical protein [Oleisolibacter albus]|uniref:hypothetical protein n=1 Tax=Oleisolibacter albus TaxID=2171757 RepID=UPI0012D70FCF|nr:hypothetical protein [Oleisolibacter albus]